MKAETFNKLRLFNIFMGALHFIQFLLMLGLSKEFKLPLTTSFLEYNPALQVPEPLTKEVAQLELGPIIAAFLLVSSIAHFIIASPLAFDWYVKNLKKGMNLARWYEYAISSSIMIVAIAMLSGVYDLPTLILMFSLNATMIFFGYMMEVHNQTTKNTDWASFIFGCFAGIVPWIVIFMYFFSALDSYEGGVPDFLYGIIISLFLFFNVFAINMYLQYRRIGPWKSYLFGEMVYIVLSLVAKSALAWQVFSGTLR